MATTGNTGTAGSALSTAGGTSTAGLADWSSGYITDYLAKAKALANKDYQVYTGPLTAAESNLQTDAFKGIGNLTVPTAISDAAKRVGTLAAKDIPAYQNTIFDNTFKDPGAYSTKDFTSSFVNPGPFQTKNFTSAFTKPDAYATTAFANPFTAPQSYQATAFDSAYQAPQTYTSVGGSFTDAGIAGKYMNPYLQQALNPQMKELQRQADIQRVADAGRLTQAGAFGGARQAIMESEGRRNLLDKQADVTSQGYATAFDKAMAQYNADQARKIQEAQFGSQLGMTSAEAAAKYRLAAQQAAEQSKQFGAKFGLDSADIAARYLLDSQKAQEQSKQFGAKFGLDSADIAARYLLEAEKASEQSKQFGAKYGLDSADVAAKYAFEAEKAKEQSRQFGSQQALTSANYAAQNAMEAKRLAENSKQFGATYGLDALAKQIDAARVQSEIAKTQAEQERAILNQQLNAGGIKRAIDQEGITADLDEFNAQRKFDYDQVKFMRDMISGLPVGSVTNEPNQLSGIAQFITAAGGIDRLLKDTGSTDLTSLLRRFGLTL